MSKDYNIDDILLEIKAKKSRQGQKGETGEAWVPEKQPEYQEPEPPKEPETFRFQWQDEPQTETTGEKFTIRLPDEEPEEPSRPVRMPEPEKPAAEKPEGTFTGFSFGTLEPEKEEKTSANETFAFRQPDVMPASEHKLVKPGETFKVTLPDEGKKLNLDYDKYFDQMDDEPQDKKEEDSPFQFHQTSFAPPLDVMEATREVPTRNSGLSMPQDSGETKEPFRLNFNLDDDLDEPEADLSDLTPPSELHKGGLFPSEMLDEDHKEKKKNTFRHKAKEENEEAPKQEEDDSELDDYSSPADKESVIRDMKMIKMGLMVRLLLMLIVFGTSLYLALSVTSPTMSLPGWIHPESHLREFMIANTVVAAIGAIICSNTVGGGILSLLKLKADTDALPSMAVIAALAQGVCFIVKPNLLQMAMVSQNTTEYTITTAFSLFFPVAMLILVFNLIGKIMIILRIQNNFRLVASDRSKYSVNIMENKGLLKEWTKDLEMEEYLVAYPVKTKFLSHFLEYSYSEDHAENTCRVLAPITILAGILISVLAYVFNHNIAVAISTFAAAMCICAPLTSTIVANWPMLRLSSKLIPSGAMVAGYESIDQFADTEGVVMKTSDIFPPENVTLHGIKAFDQSKIDSVILDAASVVCSSHGMLSSVFEKIIGSNKDMLRPVENVTYEDSMGLSAWVDGKRVLVGNRDLMINHGIEVPSSDYESRYVKDSKNIVYLSNSGELSAMFVISYNPNNQVMDSLDKLADNGMFLIVETSDPNITKEKIHEAYDFPLEQIQIMPAKTSDQYRELAGEHPQAASHIGYMGGARNMVRAICDCITTKTAISTGVIIQMAALIIGYGIISVFALVGDLGMMKAVHLIAYQLIWALIISVIPNTKKL